MTDSIFYAVNYGYSSHSCFCESPHIFTGSYYTSSLDFLVWNWPRPRVCIEHTISLAKMGRWSKKQACCTQNMVALLKAPFEYFTSALIPKEAPLYENKIADPRCVLLFTSWHEIQSCIFAIRRHLRDLLFQVWLGKRSRLLCSPWEFWWPFQYFQSHRA